VDPPSTALARPVFFGKIPRLIPRARVNREVLRYWLSKRTKARLPPRAAIEPGEVVRLLPNIMLIDVEYSPLRFRFRLVGTHLVRVYGEEYTGRYLDELDLDDHRRAITCDYREAAQCGIAQCDEYAYRMESDRYRHFERLLLPLSADGEIVNMLLGSLYEFTFSEDAVPKYFPVTHG
jgi:hypothetical protein